MVKYTTNAQKVTLHGNNYSLENIVFKGDVIEGTILKYIGYITVHIRLMHNGQAIQGAMITITPDPFSNCQITSIGYVSSLGSLYAYCRNQNLNKESKTLKEEIWSVIHQCTKGKSTLMCDVHSSNVNEFTNFFDFTNIRKIGAYQNKNTGSNLTTYLVDL